MSSSFLADFVKMKTAKVTATWEDRKADTCSPACPSTLETIFKTSDQG